MAKNEKPKPGPGRFIHMDFPPEGVDETVDAHFRMLCLQTCSLEPFTQYQVKVSYTGKLGPRKEEGASVEADVLRLVK